jgi:hypothetical protein
VLLVAQRGGTYDLKVSAICIWVDQKLESQKSSEWGNFTGV